MIRRLIFPMLATFVLVTVSHVADVEAGLFRQWRPDRVSTQRSVPPARCMPVSNNGGNSRMHVENWRVPRGQDPSKSTSTFKWGVGIHYGQ